MASKIWVLVAGSLLLSGCKSQEEVHPIGEFLPVSEAFWRVVPRQAVIERIGIAFEFTEGPAWHPKGYLVFSDIPANTIYRWTEKKFVIFRQPSNQANGLLFQAGGDLLACEHESRSITRLSPTGTMTTLIDSCQGKRSQGQGQAMCHPIEIRNAVMSAATQYIASRHEHGCLGQGV